MRMRPFKSYHRIESSRKKDTHFVRNVRTVSYLYEYRKVIIFPDKCIGTLYDDSYQANTSAGAQKKTSLKSDPRRVLRSLGQDSSLAARTATAYTWARGGAHCHGGIRAAPYAMRGAAWQSDCRGLPSILHSSSSSSKESRRSAPAT